MLDRHGVVCEAHGDAVGHADQLCGVEVEFAVDVQLVQGSVQRERSLSGSLQSYDLIGHETVDEVERELVHRQFCVEQSLALVLVGTRERSHLLFVLSDDGIDIVRSVLLRHIDHFGPHVAMGAFS